jgi:hypothetical protein
MLDIIRLQKQRIVCTKYHEAAALSLPFYKFWLSRFWRDEKE